MSLRLHLAYTFFRALALTVLVAAPLAILYAAQPTLPGWLQGPVSALLFPVELARMWLLSIGHSGVFERMYGVFLALLLGYLPILWLVIGMTTPRDKLPAKRGKQSTDDGATGLTQAQRDAWKNRATAEQTSRDNHG